MDAGAALDFVRPVLYVATTCSPSLTKESSHPRAGKRLGENIEVDVHRLPRERTTTVAGRSETSEVSLCFEAYTTQL